jgi:uncharacterized membrane protein
MSTYAPTRSERVLYATTGAVVVLTWLLSFYFYPALPDRIAIHFDVSGKPNGWGSKRTIFAAPAIMTGGILIMMLVRFKVPADSYNIPVELTQENRNRQYRNMFQMLAMVSLAIALFMAWMQYEISYSALHDTG